MADYATILEAMIELEDEELLEYANEIMENGGEGAAECMRACQEGMTQVGNRFEDGTYFIGDLVFAGDLMKQVMDVIRPALTADATENYGEMILCTVLGDLHDIGKNIVKAMMEGGGFQVNDLGIDVKPEDIVKTAKENNIRIIGLSGVLTLAIDSMKDTVEAFKNAGLRENVKIIIGGNPITAEACEYVGADAWAINPQDSVKICREWSQTL